MSRSIATITPGAAEAAPLVRAFLPLLPDTGTALKPDQTEQVILNGRVTQIRRGEYVDVSVPVFTLLRQRYEAL